jgi:hypothetical protein
MDRLLSLRSTTDEKGEADSPFSKGQANEKLACGCENNSASASGSSTQLAVKTPPRSRLALELLAVTGDRWDRSGHHRDKTGAVRRACALMVVVQWYCRSIVERLWIDLALIETAGTKEIKKGGLFIMKNKDN